MRCGTVVGLDSLHALIDYLRVNVLTALLSQESLIIKIQTLALITGVLADGPMSQVSVEGVGWFPHVDRDLLKGATWATDGRVDIPGVVIALRERQLLFLVPLVIEVIAVVGRIDLVAYLYIQSSIDSAVRQDVLLAGAHAEHICHSIGIG